MESKPEQIYVKKKGSKKKRLVIGSIVIIIVLGILGTAMANTIIAAVAPDQYILLSMLQMKKLSAKERNAADTLHPKDKKTSLSLNLKEVDGIYDDYLKEILEGSGISLSIANSEVGDILIDTEFKKSETSLINLSLYSSKDKLGIKIPGLLNQYIMVDLKQFKQKYDQSDLVYYLGDIDQSDVDLANNYISQARNAISGPILGIDSQFNNDLEESLMELVKGASIKHTGKTKVSINNKNKSVDRFSIVIDSGDIKSFIKGVTKSAIKHTDLIDTILTDENYYSKAELEEVIYAALDEVKLSDIEITCAIDNKRRIVNSELNTAIGINDEKVKITSDYTLSGDHSIYDTVEANLSLNSEQGLSATVNIEKDLKATEDNFALASKVIVNGDASIDFKLSGDLLKNKTDRETSLDANKIEFKVEEYGDIISIRGSGSFKVENLKDQSLAISDEQQLDLFSIGTSEIFDIATRIGTQFYDMGNLLNYIY